MCLPIPICDVCLSSLYTSFCLLLPRGDSTLWGCPVVAWRLMHVCFCEVWGLILNVGSLTASSHCVSACMLRCDCASELGEADPDVLHHFVFLHFWSSSSHHCVRLFTELCVPQCF